MLETYQHLTVGEMRKILNGKLQHPPYRFGYKCNISNDNTCLHFTVVQNVFENIGQLHRFFLGSESKTVLNFFLSRTIPPKSAFQVCVHRVNEFNEEMCSNKR
jgi:hypothetical protein